MSRRSRKRRAAGAGNRWLGKAAVGVLALCIVLMAAAYLSLRSYLRSESFRKFLALQVAKTSGIEGDFAPFAWDGLAVDTRSFAGTGDRSIRSVTAEDMHTEIGFGGVRRGVWEVRGSSVRRLEVELDARGGIAGSAAKAETAEETEPAAAAEAKSPPWYPNRAELESVSIGRLGVSATLDAGVISASGMSVTAERTGKSGDYNAVVEGGSIRAPYDFLPELRLGKARLRYSDHRIFLTKARVSAWENGRIDASGEWDMDTKRFALEGEADGLDCADVFSESWAKRLTGGVQTSFRLQNATGEPIANGSLGIGNGTLTALPVLDALAAYADTRRFRVLTLNEARTDWRWRKGEISLTNLVLSSEGLVRLEGSLTIRDRNLDGLFRLGIAPGTLANIPGAETDVFIAGTHGLLWTTLRIGGTLDDPKEDLSDRLFDAAGARMFDMLPETGERVLKYTRSVLGDRPDKLIDKGVRGLDKGLDKGVEIIGKGAGILDGFLGGDRKEP